MVPSLLSIRPVSNSPLLAVTHRDPAPTVTEEQLPCLSLLLGFPAFLPVTLCAVMLEALLPAVNCVCLNHKYSQYIFLILFSFWIAHELNVKLLSFNNILSKLNRFVNHLCS